MVIGKIKQLISLYFLKKKWRKINSNNETVIKRVCDISNIKVGKMSYGPIEVYEWGSKGEGLKIGSYVSIAEGVKFILGGNHRYKTISTYPFKVKLGNEKMEAYTNGEIIVEDDVWIGMEAIIMSGVRIGKGAIIAAGSVVTKNVPNYAIVGGNPANIIKYRFDDSELINSICNLDISKLSDNFIYNNINLFYKDVDKNLINKINEIIIK